MIVLKPSSATIHNKDNSTYENKIAKKKSGQETRFTMCISIFFSLVFLFFSSVGLLVGLGL